jgi:hypothetical protein
MKENYTFFDTLLNCIKYPPAYDPREQSSPVAILWPDKGREWEPLLPRLRAHLPILTLGAYEADHRSGPAIWLRCMLARTLVDKLTPNAIPVLYMPGIGADDLRLSWQRPKTLEPLVELLYRSELWVNRENQDWTVADFFQDGVIGPHIQTRDDDFTRKAMRRALPALCDLTLAQLREEEPWKAKDFEGLLEKGLSTLLTLDESAELEFKSTARWDMRENKHNPVLEKVIVKSVAGLLNAPHGGTLLIGVQDDKRVCGIEMDYPTFSRPDKRNPDAYERWLMGRLLNALGQEFAPSIHITFHLVDDLTVCKVAVAAAPWPAIVTENGSEIFYLRTGNGTDQIGIRAVLNYYQTRWRAS